MGVQAIVDLAESNGGLVTTAQVVGAGVPRARISDMVKTGDLERVQRGVYCLNSLPPNSASPKASSRTELRSISTVTPIACRFNSR